MYKAFGNRTILVIVTLALAVSDHVSAQGNRLTVAQIKQLIQIHAPDDVVAKEIQSRGLDFAPTLQIIEQLGKGGGGQATLAALRDAMPNGALEVQTTPGSHVAIDGIDQGVTDAQGRLVLPRLLAGAHRLSVVKADYRTVESDFNLAAKEYKRVPLQLAWAGGYLTVRSDPPGATIDLAGFGQFKDGVSDYPLREGTYDITVARKGMKTQTQTAVVTAGQHQAIDIHLVANPEYIRDTLADAKRNLARGNTRDAIQVSNDLLALAPNNFEVETLLAAAYLRAKDLEHFQEAASELLRTGGSLNLDVAHEHLEPSGEAIHSAVLTLTATSVVYEPTAPCKYGRLEAPLGNIDALEVTNKAQSGILVVRHLVAGTFLLHLELRDPGKPKNRITLFFAMPDSRIELQNGIKFLASPNDSVRILSALANLIHAQAVGTKK